MELEKIHFNVDRNFGQTFNTSLKFLKQNFKLFLQSLLYIVGPFILISALSAAYYQEATRNIVVLTRDGDMYQFWVSISIYIVSAIVSSLLLIGAVYSFMITYHEKGPNNFTVSDVRKKLAKSIGHLIGAFFTMLLYVLLACIVLFGIGFIFGSISPVLAAFYIFFIVIGLIIVGPPIAWVINAVYLIKLHEGGNAFFAFGRARDLLKRNFWWTWLIITCASVALMLVSFIFAMPQVIYKFILEQTPIGYDSEIEFSIPFMIVVTVCTIGTTLLYSVLYIFSGIHYYSLAERKEGKGMLERINEIGNKPINDVEQHY